MSEHTYLATFGYHRWDRGCVMLLYHCYWPPSSDSEGVQDPGQDKHTSVNDMDFQPYGNSLYNTYILSTHGLPYKPYILADQRIRVQISIIMDHL